MPLVVSSLTGDAPDVFDWILSLNPGNTQDLTTLLQMLREHYCGSLTFREQRNTIENLFQRPQEAAIDVLIRVGTSVSNLGKDWRDELTDKELQSLQYEVSLNGVQEEIRHVLDSEIAKNGGKPTPQQMYETVKRYETYVAHNKRLKGKGTSLSASQQKGKDNTVADFLSRMSECLPEEEVQEYLNKIPYPGVKAVLDNAITPIEEHAEQGVRLTPDCQGDCQEETVEARPARLATTNVTDWKQEQKEDPVLYQVAKHLRVPCKTFKVALHKVLDKKATAAYVKVKEQLLIKNGLLYCKTRQGQADEIVFQFVVPQRHWGTTLDGCHQEAAHQGQRHSTALMEERFWWPGMT